MLIKLASWDKKKLLQFQTIKEGKMLDMPEVGPLKNTLQGLNEYILSAVNKVTPWVSMHGQRVLGLLACLGNKDRVEDKYTAKQNKTKISIHLHK